MPVLYTPLHRFASFNFHSDGIGKTSFLYLYFLVFYAILPVWRLKYASC
ncbi:hypothetical protein TREVI0001_0796 [Treponema vincentii ATCC 35580]|uniref:Uncharacterized protein n=1 Tax=Treponema vincentii ATCC 35580 TaxID=596324 RepID=C8PRA5_9SPIR|nr:hypothetical protein TREVI0001_0796 [Treponema vincentii ATCC 35580]